jgi:hypothetical protein
MERKKTNSTADGFIVKERLGVYSGKAYDGGKNNYAEQRH